jgi:hypothetical protein
LIRQGVIAAVNDLPGVNVRNIQVDSSGEAAEITVGLKTGVCRSNGCSESSQVDATWLAMSYDQR